MPVWRERLRRIRGFSRLVMSLVVGGVALVTAVAYWESRLGYGVVAVFGAVVVPALAAVVLLPERAWVRVVGIDMLAADLGELHSEGALLRSRLPWRPDDDLEDFDQWAAEVDDWFARTRERLADTAWLGTLLSPVIGFRTNTDGYAKASNYRNGLDDKLQRLSEIIAAVSRGE